MIPCLTHCHWCAKEIDLGHAMSYGLCPQCFDTFITADKPTGNKVNFIKEDT